MYTYACMRIVKRENLPYCLSRAGGGSPLTTNSINPSRRDLRKSQLHLTKLRNYDNRKLSARIFYQYVKEHDAKVGRTYHIHI